MKREGERERRQKETECENVYGIGISTTATQLYKNNNEYKWMCILLDLVDRSTQNIYTTEIERPCYVMRLHTPSRAPQPTHLSEGQGGSLICRSLEWTAYISASKDIENIRNCCERFHFLSHTRIRPSMLKLIKFIELFLLLSFYRSANTIQRTE